MCLFCRCEEATEVETHHQQTAATTMGVAEDDTPSSLTSHPNPNVNNPNQEGTCQSCDLFLFFFFPQSNKVATLACIHGATRNYRYSRRENLHRNSFALAPLTISVAFESLGTVDNRRIFNRLRLYTYCSRYYRLS